MLQPLAAAAAAAQNVCATAVGETHPASSGSRSVAETCDYLRQSCHKSLLLLISTVAAADHRCWCCRCRVMQVLVAGVGSFLYVCEESHPTMFCGPTLMMLQVNFTPNIPCGGTAAAAAAAAAVV
jgi:hypothetical protein